MFWHLFSPPLVLSRAEFLWQAKKWAVVHRLLGSHWHQVLHPLLHICPYWEVAYLFVSPELASLNMESNIRIGSDHSVFFLLSCNLCLAKLSLSVLWYIFLSVLHPQGKLSLIQLLTTEADFLALTVRLMFYYRSSQFNSLCWPKL